MIGAKERPHLAAVERWSLRAAGVSLSPMVLMVGAEVIARSLFHHSFEVVDEVGGYLLVSLSFFSLAPALASGSFHTVELVQAHLSAAAKRVTGLFFDLLSLLFAVVMVFTIARYVWRTYEQGDVASTTLQTPLWIPQMAMILGMLALALTLLRKVFFLRAATKTDGGQGDA